jgi:hypothetical protein
MTQAFNLSQFANKLNSSGQTDNTGLQNNSVTISPGTGMSGGGAVALGSSVTINNAGVTSLAAGTGISVSSSTGGVTVSANRTGSIVQVLQTFKSNTFTASQPNWVDVTGLSVTITPSSSSSKILIIPTINFTVNAAGGSGGWRIVRNSTPIGIADTAGSRPQFSGANLDANGGNTQIWGSSQAYIDSPATTSATTYKIQCFYAFSGSDVWYLNLSPTDRDSSTYDARSASAITVMEIAG